MIVTKLMGGLGNQMFQYAAGKALALKNGVPLLLDDSFLNTDSLGAYTKRTLELQQFNIKINLADEKLLQTFKQNSLWRKLFSKGRPDVLIEGEAVNTNFFKTGGNVYLDGYWQSELYFEQCRDAILEAFTPKYDLRAVAGKYLPQMQNSNSISIHVRRGDYVHLKSAGQFHGSVGMDYYLKAMSRMTGKIKNAGFFIFSDDMDWCRQNFSDIPFVTFVETNSPYSSTDLLLMTNCKHNIIANSSYSWWAAWLNQHPDKIVIAPEKWFAEKSMKAETIYCKAWQVL